MDTGAPKGYQHRNADRIRTCITKLTDLTSGPRPYEVLKGPGQHCRPCSTAKQVFYPYGVSPREMARFASIIATVTREQWSRVLDPQYRDSYEVSDQGRVRS